MKARWNPKERFILAVVALLPALAGCAGWQHYDAGRAAMAAQDYDRAVSELREAIRQEPDNGVYLTDLAQAESLAADAHIRRAKKEIEQNQLETAREELRVALQFVPTDPEALALLDSVNHKIAVGWTGQHISAARPAAVSPGSESPRSSIAAAHPEDEAVRSPDKGPDTDNHAERSFPVARRPASGALEVITVERPAASRGEYVRVFGGVVSRDDDRYRSSVQASDGIVVKVKDTDSHPLSADMEIISRGDKLERRGVQLGQPVQMRGDSGSLYRLIIDAIDREKETVHFRIERFVARQ